MSTPPPRPALRRAPDAAVSPALPRYTSSAPEHEQPHGKPGKPDPKDDTRAKKKDEKKHEKKHGRKSGKKSRAAEGTGDIDVSFPLSPKVLARLDKRADHLGHSRERTLSLLVEAWLDG